MPGTGTPVPGTPVGSCVPFERDVGIQGGVTGRPSGLMIDAHVNFRGHYAPGGDAGH